MLTRIGVMFFWLIHFLPFRAIVAIGNGIGIALFPLATRRRKIGMINMRLCFPEMSDANRERMVREHFKMFCRAAVERSILWWASAERIRSLIRVEGIEHFNNIKNSPAILLAPHFVGIDVGGQWVAIHTDGVSMYANQKSKYLSDLLLKKRARFRKQHLFARQEGLRPVLRSIRGGASFYYLPDQDQGVKDGVFIPFFGVPAATVTAVPRIAKITGAKVVPTVTRLLPRGGGYVVRFFPAWENYPSGDDVADTRRVNEFIEEAVREIPEQYFWLHRRFKTRPEGDPSFYSG